MPIARPIARPIASKLFDIKHSQVSKNAKTAKVFLLECFAIYGKFQLCDMEKFFVIENLS